MGYKTPTCPVGRACGACEWLNVPYEIQLRRKHDELAKLFAEFDTPVENVRGMADPTHYRAKVMAPFVRGARGRIVFGMYARGTHKIVQARECLVEYPQGHAILQTIAALAHTFKIEPYNEDTGRGLLRHTVVRLAQASGKAMVTLVINRREFPRKKAFVAELTRRHPEIATVAFSVNTRKTNVVLGPGVAVAYGPGYLEDVVCGCAFRIPPLAFYQTNPQQTEVLYNVAVELADLGEGDTVFDAYCGIGTIGIIAAKRTGAALVGVESVPSAVQVARENARLNKVRDARFVTGDAGECLAKLAADRQPVLAQGLTMSEQLAALVAADERGCAGVPSVVFMDPPRAGASEQFIESLRALAPSRVVYVSCNPTTQLRDLRLLVGKGDGLYRVARIVPVDMFPHTKHVETVVLMSRKDT